VKKENGKRRGYLRIIDSSTTTARLLRLFLMPSAVIIVAVKDLKLQQTMTVTVNRHIEGGQIP
jgi:hypothetical protein